MNKLITWFEIPATDLNRAVAFYETLLAAKLNVGEMAGTRMAVFPYEHPTATGGALVEGPNLRPASDGVVVYLWAGESLGATLARVVPAGGSVALPATELPNNIGFIAHIVDTEGNRVGLHAMK